MCCYRFCKIMFLSQFLVLHRSFLQVNCGVETFILSARDTSQRFPSNSNIFFFSGEIGPLKRSDHFCMLFPHEFQWTAALQWFSSAAYSQSGPRKTSRIIRVILQKGQITAHCDSEENYKMRHSKRNGRSTVCFAPTLCCTVHCMMMFLQVASESGSELIMRPDGGHNLAPSTMAAFDRLTQCLPTEMSLIRSMICRCVCFCGSSLQRCKEAVAFAQSNQ